MHPACTQQECALLPLTAPPHLRIFAVESTACRPAGRPAQGGAMTQDSAVEDIVHRHAKAIVTMDIGQIMNDLMPDAMMKLQQEAGGGTAMQINSYELLGNSRDGDDYLFDVKYIGPQSFTVRARWSRVGPEWKIIDADIIARE